jgi:hypothetical protein
MQLIQNVPANQTVASVRDPDKAADLRSSASTSGRPPTTTGPTRSRPRSPP